MTRDLLPCPFCGESEGIYVEQSSRYAWFVRCSNCNATHTHATEIAAIEAWNTRAKGGER